MRHLKGHLKSIIVSWERQLCTVWTTSGSKQLSSAWWFRRKAILVRLPVKRTVIIAMSDCVGTDTRNPAEILMTFTTSNWYSGSTLVYSWLLNLFFFTTQVSSSTSCRCCGSTSLAAWQPGSKVVWCCYQDIWQPVWQPDRGISNPHTSKPPTFSCHFFEDTPLPLRVSGVRCDSTRSLTAGQWEDNKHYVNDEVMRRYLCHRT